MKRRRFLSSLLGLAAVPVAARLPVITPETKVLKDMYGRIMTPVGLGMSEVKREGGIIVAGNFPRALWPGLKKLYGESYEK